MKLLLKVLLSIAASFLFIYIFSACQINNTEGNNGFFSSYLEVPGITEDEIRSIAALRARGEPLIYAASRSTELFIDQNDSHGGYTVLLTNWLSDFFNLEFQCEIMSLTAMLDGLRDGSLSFATLSATQERREAYYMADIAQRSIVMLRRDGSPSITSILNERLPRYVFTAGSVIIDLARNALGSGTYEEIIVADEAAAYDVVMSGAGDAFLATNTMEAAFDHLGGIYAEKFLPLIFQPAAMTAEDPAYAAVISVLNKALEHGAREFLGELYRDGYHEYTRQKFYSMLTPEERAFLEYNPVIPYVTHFMAYPMSFFNTSSGEWEGAVFEVLEELSFITGLNFELINDNTVEQPELLSLVENGTAYFIPYMIISGERRDRFIFSSVMYISDTYALLSKRSYPNIELNDIPMERVGYARGSGFADMFRHWFPNAVYAVEYLTTDDAFEALDRGDVDLVMASLSRLSALTNYYEYSDYKANFLFNMAFDATFGFNREQTVLASIIDKALPMINTERIVQQWSSRTYGIEAMRLQSQRPWLISAIILSLLVLFLVIIMLIRNRKMTFRLQRTIADVRRANIQAEIAVKTKTAFLANMSHELRTPLNSTLNMLREAMTFEGYNKSSDALNQAMASSNDLLSVINTILEISNIESGQLILENENFSLGDLVNDINSLLSALCKAKGTIWELKTGSIAHLTVEGDRIRLMQALTILLRNAVKLAGDDHGKVTFNASIISETENNAGIRFEITDNGIGMTDKKLEEIHHILNADNNDINFSSTEIMLFACSSIIRSMGTEIYVENHKDSGSCFSFNISLRKVFIEKEREKISTEGVSFTGKRALIVDDVRINRVVLRNVLSQAGMETIEARDGKEAVDIFLAESESIDVILMDIMMPNMDGHEAAQLIRSSRLSKARTVPIIAVTSLSYKEDRDASINSGMNYHLEKPVEPDTLLSTLMRYL